MKSQSFFSILVFFLLLTSCNENSKTGVQHRIISDKSTVFKVTISAVIKKIDDFSLYYTTDGSINFQKIPAIWIGVKGSNSEQEITFSLPKNVKPTQLRIDMGRNPKQAEIILKWVKLSYNGKAVDLPGTMVFSYFRPNVKSTKADATSGRISGITVNGVRQTPSLYPKENPLRKQIDYLTE